MGERRQLLPSLDLRDWSARVLKRLQEVDELASRGHEERRPTGRRKCVLV